MRKILVIGRNWSEIDAWMNTVNDRFAGCQLEGVLASKAEDKVRGIRHPQVVILDGVGRCPESERLDRLLALQSAVFLNP